MTAKDIGPRYLQFGELGVWRSIRLIKFSRNAVLLVEGVSPWQYSLKGIINTHTHTILVFPHINKHCHDERGKYAQPNVDGDKNTQN